MKVTAVFAMLAIELGVRRITLMSIERVTKLFLMASFVTVRDTIGDHIGGAFQTHKEQGEDH